MTLKTLVKQIDAVAEDFWATRQPALACASGPGGKLARSDEIVAWVNLHGWDVAETKCQQLLIRQALLNAVIQQSLQVVTDKLFTTPLDALGVQAPQELVEAIDKAAYHSRSFNFWGDFYSALIPQPQRRCIGQFWTNEQIAEWMVMWLLQFQPHCLVDVGCGAGNFMLKASQYQVKSNGVMLYGFDISPLVLNVTLAAFQARPQGRSLALPRLAIQNYLDEPLPVGTDAVICNPPYTRHHQIAPSLKDKLQAFFKAQLRLNVSRQATLAFHFLLKLIVEMPEGARAAVIVPMEVLDARYGRAAKRVLCQHTTLSALIHFSPQMNAFRKVDVGASILLFQKGYERCNVVRHVTLDTLPTTEELLDCLNEPVAQNSKLAFGSLVVQPQDNLLDISKWFGIAVPEPSNSEWYASGRVVTLKTLAKVVRGIATGANDFFVLSTEHVIERSLEPFVVRTLQRNREIQDIILTEDWWQALSDEGKRVWLLYLDGSDVSDHPSLSAYLAEGEAIGYHRRSLVQTRKKWYAMEQRDIPAIFFTILTRGNPRFILNRAGVRPLNMFSLLYPNWHILEADAIELLWVLLNSTFSLSKLHSISRTYGGNTLKVEPRELDNLPVINPLALPDETKQKIQRWIGDFYNHRQISVLIRQVDELVEALLNADIDGPSLSPIPTQPRLLEAQENYESAVD